MLSSSPHKQTPDLISAETPGWQYAVASGTLGWVLDAAIAGALLFGQISELLGGRRGIMLALCVSLAALRPWAFGTSVAALILGACLMQAGVQGAFGVIPAHLNELSPDATRSLFPGLTYQLGVLLAFPAVSVEYALRNRFGYSRALTIFEGVVILSLLLIFQLGPERQGRSFRAPRTAG
jgi:SHS family lactate transporter-like MFS transporter